jgi:hypothetical protein
VKLSPAAIRTPLMDVCRKKGGRSKVQEVEQEEMEMESSASESEEVLFIRPLQLLTTICLPASFYPVPL